jgi:hypothetical protein
MNNKVISIVFISILIAVALLNLISPALTISLAERRALKQFDDLDWTNLESGEFVEDFEETVLDQFIGREFFRKLKAAIELNLMHKTDNNGYLIQGDNIYKLDYLLNEDNVRYLNEYISDIYIEHLQDSDVYLSIIPDKNYFLDDSILKLDYQMLETLLLEDMDFLEYIDIKTSLSLDDYYATDPHWKQERLAEVLETLSQSMDFRLGTTFYEEREHHPFYGAYYGQSAANVQPDQLVYLYNEYIANAIVENFENPDQVEIYDKIKLMDLDAYEVFLSGATPLIRIENPLANTDQELVIFGDSFSSSITPLLIESYASITIVDLRYMPKDLLDEYVDFEGKDVLFLYSTLLINNASVLK